MNRLPVPTNGGAAEAGLLGCILLAPEKLADAQAAGVSIGHFAELKHQALWDAICHTKATDGATLVYELGKRPADEFGGMGYLLELQNAAGAPLERCAEDLCQARARRAIVEATQRAQDLANEPGADPARIAADLADSLASLQTKRTRGLSCRRPGELVAMQFDDSDVILGDRLLALGQSMAMLGAGGIGKSRLLLQFAACTIAERYFLKFRTAGSNLRWLILQAENSNRRLHNDLSRLRQWIGETDWQKIDAQLAIHTLESDDDGFLALSDPGNLERLRHLILEIEPDIIGFDPLADFATGDLNSDMDMRRTLMAISQLSRAGNPHRAIVVLHHALTGKAGASKALGYERASFGRNSKCLHAWTRGSINVSQAEPDNNDLAVISCGKNSNGIEFEPFAARLNVATMVYEVDDSFDISAWRDEMTGTKAAKKLVSPAEVAEVAGETGMTRAELVKALEARYEIRKTKAYDLVEQSTGHTIMLDRKTDLLIKKPVPTCKR